MKISGDNFPTEIRDDLQVKIGSSPCKIIASNNKELTIETGKKIDLETITISYNSEVSSPFSGFSFDDSSAPTLSAISPKSSSPSLKKDITITGNNFGTDKTKIRVFLEGQGNSNYYELSVVSVSNAQILAVLGGGRSGNYKLIVLKITILKYIKHIY